MTLSFLDPRNRTTTKTVQQQNVEQNVVGIQLELDRCHVLDLRRGSLEWDEERRSESVSCVAVSVVQRVSTGLLNS